MTVKRTADENFEIEWNSVSEAFITEARERLKKIYLPWIRQSLEMLTDEDIWWRPNHNSNSIGNLILHLCGNIYQWIVVGLTSKDSNRIRMREFTERGLIPKVELLKKLEITLTQADQTLANFNVDLLDYHTIQGFRETSLTAIFHAIEHFSYHTGQIVYIAKLRTGESTNFYDDVDLNKLQDDHQ